jgi:hypothetical protein
MYGAIIHDKRKKVLPPTLVHRQKLGTLKWLCSKIKKAYKSSHALKMLHRLLNKTEASKGARHIEKSTH